MKSLAAILVVAFVGFAAASPAHAGQNCGAGLHQGYYGHCSANKHMGKRPHHHHALEANGGHKWWRHRHDWHHEYRPLRPN